MKRILYPFILALALGSFAGCAPVLKAQLPEGVQARPIAAAAPGAPFDVNRDGTCATVSEGKTSIVKDGRSVTASEAAALSLSFSPSGDRLALALPSGNATQLRIVDLQGKVLAETKVPGRVTSLAWRSERELLAGALSMKKYSFGSQMASLLFRWDGSSAPIAVTLSDVTLRPHVARLPEEILYNQVLIAISPYGDEIAYTTLKDPPLFAPYLRIATRHLDTDGETEIGRTAPGAGWVLYTPDGEGLLVGDGQGSTRRLAIPDGKETQSWPLPGVSAALSRSGGYLFLDGTLYRDGKTVAIFPPQSRGAFLPDGSGIIVSSDGSLYRVSGLNDGARPALPADLERLLKLRRLRSQGLITETEFNAQKNGGK